MYPKGHDIEDFAQIQEVYPKGKVLYDSRSDTTEMENHLEREEIKEAISDGYGESKRYSITLFERSLYCAMPSKSIRTEL